MNLFRKTFAMTALGLLVLLVVSIVFGLYFFGLAGVFTLFGIEYESLGSLLLFFVFFLLLGGIADLFSKIASGLAMASVKGKFSRFMVRMLIDCAFTWLALFTVDEFMQSITIPFRTELAAVLILFLVEWAFEDRKKKPAKENSAP